MSSKIGRNDPCPCGSGKKYKKCHGRHNANQAKLNAVNNELYRLHQDLISFTTTSYQSKIEEQLERFDELITSTLDDETKEIYHTGLTPWIMSSVPCLKNNETILRRFYRSTQKKLSPHARDLFVRWLHAKPSIYEIISIDSPKKQFMAVKELGEDETFFIPFQNKDDFVEGSLLIGIVIPFIEHHNFLLTMVKLYERDKNYYTELLQKYKGKKEGLSKTFPNLLAEALSSESIETEWKDTNHEEVAHLLTEHLSEQGISDRIITESISHWHTFCERENPTIKKIEPYAAAMDYYIQKVILNDSEVKQATVAETYHTYASTLCSTCRRIVQALRIDRG